MKWEKLDSFLRENFPLEAFEFRTNANLARFSTMKLEATGPILIIRNVILLEKTLPYFHANSIEYRLVGWGANQVLESQTEKIYLKLELPFDHSYLGEVRSEYVLPASISLNSLTSHAQKFGLLGWEVFTGIPASLGGAIFMNAGTNLGEIGSLVKWVKLITPEGKIRTEVITKDSFVYRGNRFVKNGEVIIEVCLKNQGTSPEVSKKIKSYLEMRAETQPLTEKTCGCVFKNFSPEWRAGQLIDLLGLKGFTYKGLTISHKHANFIENRKDANYQDFIFFGSLIKRELEYQFGLQFEFEVQL